MSEEGTKSSIGTKEPIEGVTLPAALYQSPLIKAMWHPARIVSDSNWGQQENTHSLSDGTELQALQHVVQVSSHLTVVIAEEDETKFAKSLNCKIHLFCQFQMSAGGCAALRWRGSLLTVVWSSSQLTFIHPPSFEWPPCWSYISKIIV